MLLVSPRSALSRMGILVRCHCQSRPRPGFFSLSHRRPLTTSTNGGSPVTPPPPSTTPPGDAGGGYKRLPKALAIALGGLTGYGLAVATYKFANDGTLTAP